MPSLMKEIDKFPRINGLTDADLSIHLNTRVGPAKPLASRDASPSFLLDEDEKSEEAHFSLYCPQYTAKQHQESPPHERQSESTQMVIHPNTSTPLPANQFRSNEYLTPPPMILSEFSPFNYKRSRSTSTSVPIHSPSSQDDDYNYLSDDSTASTTCTESDLDPLIPDEMSFFKPTHVTMEENNVADDHPIYDAKPPDNGGRGIANSMDNRDGDRLNDKMHPQQHLFHGGRSSRKSINKLPLLLFFSSFVFAFSLFAQQRGLISRACEVTRSLFASINLSPAGLGQVSSLISRLECDVDKLTALVDQSLSGVSDKLEHLESSILSGALLVKSLQHEFTLLKTALGLCQDKNSSTCPSLDEFIAKLARVQTLSDNAEELREEMIKRLIDALPLAVPVYYKDQDIYFAPDFERYLHSFVDEYMHTRNFLEYKHDDLLPLRDLLYVSKTQFKDIISSKLDANNATVLERMSDLVERQLEQQPRNMQSFERDSAHVFADNLAEIARGSSLPKNYADYSQGARILGFLTSRGDEKKKDRLILGKILFGWYDGLRSPPIHRANTVLMQTDEIWTCIPGFCGLGIHLVQPIIVENIIVHHRVAKPFLVDIYLRPHNARLLASLSRHLENLQILQPAQLPSRYLGLFLRIKSQSPNIEEDDASRTIIQIPRSVVMLKVPVQDLYLSFSSPNHVDILHVEVFEAQTISNMPFFPKPTFPLHALGDDELNDFLWTKF